MNKFLLGVVLALVAAVAAVGFGSVARADVRQPKSHVYCWFFDYEPWFACDYSQDDWN